MTLGDLCEAALQQSDNTCRDGDAERARWAIDGYENVVAEIGAALGIRRGRAGAQLDCAIALRDELPRVAAVFCTGAIDYPMVATFVWRTRLIEDRALLARVDAALARYAPAWTGLSRTKLVQRVDWWVAWFDPAGVRVPATAGDNRYVVIEPTYPGRAGVWANLALADAVVLDERLDALAGGVCAQDPRNHRQRRADALIALAGLRDRLACRCGSPACPAAATDAPVAEVVIHVLAEQASVEGRADRPAVVIGRGPVPAHTLRELARTATLTPLRMPAGAAEPGYARRGVGGICPRPRHDLPLPRLRQARRGVRYQPHRALPARAHPPVESQTVLPRAPSAQNVLPRRDTQLPDGTGNLEG